MPGRRSVLCSRIGLPVFLACLTPLGVLAFDIYRDLNVPGTVFGADPAEEIVHYLGEWAIRMLLATLAISPLSRLFKWPGLIALRRMFGLFAFCYVVAHFMAYLTLLVEFDMATFVGDFVKRPYITAGISALVCLIPLALTSTRGWQQRLGANWRRLHRLVYLVGGLGCVHLIWLSKSNYAEAFFYSLILAVLLGERIVRIFLRVWERQ